MAPQPIGNMSLYPVWVQPHYWTAGGGTQAMPGFSSFKRVDVNGVSANGSTIVGTTQTEYYGSNPTNAFRWTSTGGRELLSGINTALQSGATDISANGDFIVGYHNATAHAPNTNTGTAFRWSAANGPEDLGTLPGSNGLSQATAISADGQVVVGNSITADQVSHYPYHGSQAFQWTSNGGIQSVGDLPGGDNYSVATGISADGSTVVGYSSATSGIEGFAWTETSGMVSLGNFRPADVSADGSVVVGSASIWDSTNGLQSITTLLSDMGLASEISGWSYFQASGISDDGLTLTGSARNPFQQGQGWIITIPEPSSALLLAGLPLLGLASRRQRRK